MRKSFLKKIRDTLAKEKKQLLREIEADLKEGREGSKGEGMDAYDIATEERSREISLILSDREREKLQAIESALERIEEGSYGICEKCGEEIAQERLEVMPFTRLCLTCQAEEEKEARTHRRADEEWAYRRAGLVDLDEESST
jgi:DnaK suppressor protein